MFRRADGVVGDVAFAAGDDAVSDFGDHLLDEEAEVAAGLIIGGGDVSDTIRSADELVAFTEAGAAGILRIIDGDGVAAVLADDGEAGHVGGAVADIDHVVEGDRPEIGGHVVIHVLRVVEEAFIDAEEELGLLSVGDDALWKSDAAFAILGEFAAEDGFDVRGETRAINERLEPAADDVVLHADAEGFMLGAQ